MGENARAVMDASFDDEVLKAEGPVVVDFWAEWCNPCKMITPIFEELAGAYTGKVKFVKVNVDENSETPAKYGVRGIPTLMLFKNGSVAATRVGALGKAQLVEFLDSHLG